MINLIPSGFIFWVKKIIHFAMEGGGLGDPEIGNKLFVPDQFGTYSYNSVMQEKLYCTNNSFRASPPPQKLGLKKANFFLIGLNFVS